MLEQLQKSIIVFWFLDLNVERNDRDESYMGVKGEVTSRLFDYIYLSYKAYARSGYLILKRFTWTYASRSTLRQSKALGNLSSATELSTMYLIIDCIAESAVIGMKD